MTDFEFGTGDTTPAVVTSAPVHATEAATDAGPALTAAIEGQRGALNAAQSDLADASDRGGFDDFVGGLFGSDDGAVGGESDLHSSRSELDRATTHVEAGQGIDDMLREPSESWGDGGGHDHHSGVAQAEIYATAYDDGDDDLPDGS